MKCGLAGACGVWHFQKRQLGVEVCRNAPYAWPPSLSGSSPARTMCLQRSQTHDTALIFAGSRQTSQPASSSRTPECMRGGMHAAAHICAWMQRGQTYHTDVLLAGSRQTWCRARRTSHRG
eukprot:364938-Chlamydomonas_euryale.AAC.38